MKKIRNIVLMALAVFLGSCGDESLEQIGDPEFYVRLPETAPATAFPNKEISFPVEVSAKNGLEKVEVRVNFQTLNGSAVSSFENPKQALYHFSFTPSNHDLGRNLEFAIVAYDQKGFTYDMTYTVKIILEPVIMEFTLPNELPDTLEVGDVLDFDIHITSKEALARVETIYDGNSMPGLVVESFDNPHISDYHFSYELQENDGGKNIIFTFKATDIEQKFKEIFYTLYVIGKRTPLPINAYTSVTLGMQSNTETGPFIALETNTVYTVPDAKINSGTVDLGVFRSASSGINVFAPSYENAATFIYNAANWGDDNLSSWSVRNATEIRRISSDLITAEDFDSMTDDERILEVFALSGPSVDNVTKVAVGEIIGFKTVDGEHGLMLIKGAIATATGSITFDYKIQQ